MTEHWIDIPGYAGYYQASDLGRVRSLNRVIHWGRGFTKKWPGRILAPGILHAGYYGVVLCKFGHKKHLRVSRLIALSWLGPCPSGMECCHNDGDKTNDNLLNLRWGTPKENGEDKILHSRSGRVAVRRSDGLEFDGVREAARVTGHDSSSISKACRGKLKSVQGYSWEYV